MSCTTLLIGKRATYDGSTIVARNDDSGSGEFTPKLMAVVQPAEQPKVYRSVISHVEVDLSGLEPLRYSCVPNALKKDGIWAAAGINDADVAMTATESITSNARVLGADPLVELRPAQGKPGEEGYIAEQPGGIGEEDLITLVLPYVHSAREGVLRLGGLLEKYGTYEMNGVGFSDLDEVWWLETVGGHHWIARRVPDDCCVTMPNQLGIDRFDLADAEGEGSEYLCSRDLRTWMQTYHLDLTLRAEGDAADVFNPREAFGSASDADHIYNTPRAWAMQRHLSPRTVRWEGHDADYTPESDDIPWCIHPERLLTIEDVKSVLTLHYQGTPFDCYGSMGTPETRNLYRPIGINRSDDLTVLHLRPYAPEGCRAVHWITYGSNVFNALAAIFPRVSRMPDYLANTTATVTTDNFYWANRLVAALADAHFNVNLPHVERYQEKVAALGHALLVATDRAVAEAADGQVEPLLEDANDHMADDLRRETDALLANVLYTSSMGMRNAFARSDG